MPSGGVDAAVAGRRDRGADFVRAILPPTLPPRRVTGDHSPAWRRPPRSAQVTFSEAIRVEESRRVARQHRAALPRKDHFGRSNLRRQAAFAFAVALKATMSM